MPCFERKLKRSPTPEAPENRAPERTVRGLCGGKEIKSLTNLTTCTINNLKEEPCKGGKLQRALCGGFSRRKREAVWPAGKRVNPSPGRCPANIRKPCGADKGREMLESVPTRRAQPRISCLDRHSFPVRVSALPSVCWPRMALSLRRVPNKRRLSLRVKLSAGPCVIRRFFLGIAAASRRRHRIVFTKAWKEILEIYCLIYKSRRRFGLERTAAEIHID